MLQLYEERHTPQGKRWQAVRVEGQDECWPAWQWPPWCQAPQHSSHGRWRHSCQHPRLADRNDPSHDTSPARCESIHSSKQSCTQREPTSAQRQFQPKMIRDSNSDCQIYPDPDVCHISPKMLWIHYLVGVSHFAKFCKIPAVTVWEILINLLKSPRGLFLNCKENGEVIQKPNLGLQPPPKGNQVFRLVGPIVTQVSMKSAHNFFSNAAHGMTRAERTIT